MQSEKALEVIRACVAKAEELNAVVCVAVVDSGANLVAFVRMDGSWLGSVDVAIKKARTAALFDCDTDNLGTLPGESLYGIEHSNGGLITFPGGLVLPCGSAVGVSGSSVEIDKMIASAGYHVCKER